MDREWNDHRPIYLQLRDRVVAMILDGVLVEGDPLPPVRTVAAEYRVNPLTVLKSYQELGSLDLLGDFTAVVVPEPARALVQSLSLDAGEQAALACPELEAGGILLTDDTAARLAAKALGYRVHGTLGILLRALRRGQRKRSQVLADLRSIPTVTTLHIRRDLLNEVIRTVEEHSP